MPAMLPSTQRAQASTHLDSAEETKVLSEDAKKRCCCCCCCCCCRVNHVAATKYAVTAEIEQLALGGSGGYHVSIYTAQAYWTQR